MSTRQQHAQQTHHPHEASSPSSSFSQSSGPATASASAESPCAPFSPPPSLPHPQQAPPPAPNLNRDDQQVISDILAKEDFYARLGVTRDASTQKIRSAYLRRSKYDLFGKSVDGSDTTFSDALRKVFDEFLEGEYDSIMALVDQIQTLNPEIHISREGTRTVLSSMRDLCLWGGRCWSGARGEVVGLVEMHNDIQRLPFLDFRGRLAKTATLSKGIICAVAKCVPAGGVVLEKSMPGIERCEMFFV
ncbi:hypothetical protein HDU89_003606 [Geranomyces variabilis]|nr:hypothetical protein HDU89_003606 [Geranomyces variabilis]